MRDPDDIARTRAFWMASPRLHAPGAPARTVEPPDGRQAALALAVALLAQSTLLPLARIHGASPSLVLLVVAWYGIRSGTLRGTAFGVIAGACDDALAGATGVAWMCANGLAGAVAGRLANTWLADLSLALVPATILLALVRFVAFAVVLQAEGRPLVQPPARFHAALFEALLDGAAAFAVLRLRRSLVVPHARFR